MATPTELARVAAQANALRPDWPTRSVLTYLEREHATRAYRDLAVAMAYIAADPKTQTPKRLSEAGPWWKATGEVGGTAVPSSTQPRCAEPGHEHELAVNCAICRSDHLASMAPDGTNTLVPAPDQAARNAAWAGKVRAEYVRPAWLDTPQTTEGETDEVDG
jgi:hypothetical protein